MLCRYPWLFSAAVAMSPTFDLEGLLGFKGTEDYYFSAPISFLPNLGPGAVLTKSPVALLLIKVHPGIFRFIQAR